MHTVYHQGAGAGGRVSPHAHSPWPPPQLIADVPFLYTAEEQAHMGAACCTVRLTVSHMKKKEEAGICWRGDVECRRKSGYAGQGMWNAGKEEDGLECDLCL